MPRVVVLNERRQVLFVRHNHRSAGRCERFWVVPGGSLMPGETSRDAAIREVLEETGIDVELRRLLWHVEELDRTGTLRWQSYFLGVPVGGKLRIGGDPERPASEQVIDDVRYFGPEETAGLDRIYPEVMRSTFWEILDAGIVSAEPERHPVYRIRPSDGFGR